MDLSTVPPSLHDSFVGVTIRTKQQMTKFVCNDTTQNDRALESSRIARSKLHDFIVVDTGQNRHDGKPKLSILNLLMVGL